jgi:hypothetical protein
MSGKEGGAGGKMSSDVIIFIIIFYVLIFCYRTLLPFIFAENVTQSKATLDVGRKK